ncbi:hypothetical protein ACVJDU_003082 [Bradyrhizobium diazoefficiens]
MRVAPTVMPAAASSASSQVATCRTSSPPCDFGSTMPSGLPGITAARSASVMPVSSALTRT